ncbi:MAG: hypothetical protein QOI11_563, partial [Candidatus Eremiobacteraeota bacterium]|nr:hypothetical protein [Candidatus Eremiobacteraeota bacterium]
TSFPNPTNPYKIVSDQVDLTNYLGEKKGLANALSGFFDTVFASQIAAGSTGTRQISLTAVYAYALTTVPGGYEPLVAKFPLALVPQYDYPVASGASFVQQFAGFVEDQAKLAGIASEAGWYGFEFTVYSSLGTDTANRPLLTFENLVYPLADGP